MTSAQLKQANSIAKVVCVQNYYNLVHRDDDPLIDELADAGIAYVPSSHLAGSRLSSPRLSQMSPHGWGNSNAASACLAPASRAQHPSDPWHVFDRSAA